MYLYMQVDVELEDVTAAKEQVMGAIFPRATQMDFNIGAALWLAAPVACLYAPCVLMYASASYVCHQYVYIYMHIYVYRVSLCMPLHHMSVIYMCIYICIYMYIVCPYVCLCIICLS